MPQPASWTARCAVCGHPFVTASISIHWCGEGCKTEFLRRLQKPVAKAAKAAATPPAED